MLKTLWNRLAPPRPMTRTVKAKHRSARLSVEALEDRTVPSTVTDCGDFSTVTQGGWGSTPNGNNPAQYLADNFSAAFTSGVQIGDQTAGAAADNVAPWAFSFSSAQVIEDFLTTGGTPGDLGGDAVDPANPTPPIAPSGTLSGNTLALALNVGFDVYTHTAGEDYLSDLVYTGSGPLSGLTVGQILADANLVLSGGTSAYGATASDLTDAASNINNNFDSGADLGFLECPEEVQETFKVEGVKFYDANANGVKDDAGVVAGWTIYLDNDTDSSNGVIATATTDGFGHYCFTNNSQDSGVDGTSCILVTTLSANTTYYVYEATMTSWVQTFGIGGYTFSLDNSGGLLTTGPGAPGPAPDAFDFGNLKLVSGSGGKTLGYWTNRNGQAVIFDGGTANTELNMLNALNLVEASGASAGTITGGATTGLDSYNELKTWLLNANAVNMAYMLSAQLAATSLSVEATLLSDNTIIDVGNLLDGYFTQINTALGAGTINEFGDHAFITIGNLRAAANLTLGADGYTPAGDALRAYQEALKNALDALNNNQLFFVASMPAC